MISKRTKLKMLTLLLSLSCGLFVSEIILRLINFHPILMDPGLYVANNSPTLPFKMKANYDGLYGGQQVNTDADGYRVIIPDPYGTAAAQKNSPERTILILGDSVAFGHGLSNEETVGSQLQNLLLTKKLSYQVKNIGVSGYTSWNEYGAFEDYLKKYDATDVILFYVPNDMTFENDYFGISRGNAASFSRNETGFLRFTRYVYSHVYTAFLVSDTIKKLISRARSNSAPAVSDVYDLRDKQAELDYSMEALSKIQDICRQRGTRLSVAIYRDVEHYSQPENSLAYEAAIKSCLDSRGIRSFVAKSHIDSLKINEAKVFWNDPHPSRKAVGFIVQDIYKELEEMKSNAEGRMQNAE